MVKDMSEKIKIVTFGVFDYFHYGHLKLFEQCKQYGNYLIVGVQDDAEILKRKPNHQIFYNTNQRIEIIKNLRLVDEVFVSKQVELDISKIDFDVLALGEDQNHDGFKFAIEWCNKNNKKIVYLKRTQGISSTLIKENLGKK